MPISHPAASAPWGNRVGTWICRQGCHILIVLLPFFIFFWMVPFAGHLTIGRDYVIYSILNQLELQFSLAHGQFPLFVPGFATGVPASTLTLGQLYHPFPHIAALAPGYWNGMALEWNALLRFLSLGLTHLVVFLFLCRLRLKRHIAFGISLVTVYNLRIESSGRSFHFRSPKGSRTGPACCCRCSLCGSWCGR